MATLFVPKQFKTIQNAVDAAKPYDVINVSPGTYYENITLHKDHITIRAYESEVTLDGTKTGGTGISAKANHLVLEGLIIQNYTVGVSIEGSYNRFIYLRGFTNAFAFSLSGDYNILNGCFFLNNTKVAIIANGKYNQFISVQALYNPRGVMANTGEFIGNVFYKCLFIGNPQYNLRLPIPKADRNVVQGCTISDSIIGISSNFGRIAIIGNMINNCSISAIISKGEDAIIMDNYVKDSSDGIYHTGNRPLILGNTIQSGLTSGIVSLGNDGYIVGNAVTNQKDTGITVTGCNNKICNNNLRNNGINLLETGSNNLTTCPYKYCRVQNETKGKNYLDLLEIFEKPLPTFFIPSKK